MYDEAVADPGSSATAEPEVIAPPRAIPAGRRIRSGSALLVAAFLVAVGVFLTLGGFDALVSNGGAGSRAPSAAPTSVRPSGLL